VYFDNAADSLQRFVLLKSIAANSWGLEMVSSACGFEDYRLPHAHLLA
jgi:hypothetical protein